MNHWEKVRLGIKIEWFLWGCGTKKWDDSPLIEKLEGLNYKKLRRVTLIIQGKYNSKWHDLKIRYECPKPFPVHVIQQYIKYGRS